MAGRIYASRIHMITDEDPWAGARTAAREDVKAALARGVRTCPACGTEQATSGRFCDACGADTTARFRKPPQYRTPALIVLGLLLFAAASYPLARLLRDDAATERERTAQREAARKEAELARLRIDARPVRADGLPLPGGADAVAFRADQVSDAEGKIAADGRGAPPRARSTAPSRARSASPTRARPPAARSRPTRRRSAAATSASPTRRSSRPRSPRARSAPASSASPTGS